MSSTPKLGKKLQNCEYKVDLIANQIEEDERLDLDDYYDEDYYNQPYDIEDYDYEKFKEGLLNLKSKEVLQKGELEDLENLKATDLPKILAKISPQYLVRYEDDFYK